MSNLWRLLFAAAVVTCIAGCTNMSEVGVEGSAPDSDPFISGTDLHLADQRNSVYRVAGAVIKPGSYRLAAGQTVTIIAAITQAGGSDSPTTIKNAANLERVHVSRLTNGRLTFFRLDVRSGQRDRGFLIQSGDEVYVPEKGDWP